MMNVAMQAYNIKTFLLKHSPGLDLEQIDIAAYIDPTLTLTENKKLFAQKLGIPIKQIGGREKATAGRDYNRAAKKEVDASYCDWLANNCEQHCNNGSCKAFKREGCSGAVEPCRPTRMTKSIRRGSLSGGDCDVVSYCVAAHERPPQHNSRTGNPIPVKAYCVNPHKRLCRRSGYG